MWLRWPLISFYHILEVMRHIWVNLQPVLSHLYFTLLSIRYVTPCPMLPMMQGCYLNLDLSGRPFLQNSVTDQCDHQRDMTDPLFCSGVTSSHNRVTCD